MTHTDGTTMSWFQLISSRLHCLRHTGSSDFMTHWDILFQTVTDKFFFFFQKQVICMLPDKQCPSVKLLVDETVISIKNLN